MLTTPPFAPSVLRTLHSLGIRSRSDLRQTGAATAFLLLKAAGLTITRSTLWQLAAAEAGISAHQLSAPDKAALLHTLKHHPPAARPGRPPHGRRPR